MDGNSVYSQETALSGANSQVSLPNVENAFRLRLTAVTKSNSSWTVIREFEVDSTPMSGDTDEPTGTNINTSISAATKVSILIKDSGGNTVRTLVNNEDRNLGSYSDYWDCKDDGGVVVNDGVYYAILQYIVDGNVRTYDLTNSTGGTRYSFPFGSGCNTRNQSFQSNFSPFEDDFVAFEFTICSAQEVTAFIGPLWTGGDPTRIRTITNRKAFPAGTHTIYWDGLDDNGNIAKPPPGDSLITGFWRYDLPDNAIYMTGGSPLVTDISADPNYFSPFSEKCDENGNGEGVIIDYTVSEDVASVELRVYSIETGALLRTLVVSNVQAGDNVVFWDGKNNNGEYVDIGDYQVGLIATDTEGNQSKS
jgi:flagellar hook assembly protein FlgD